jgi:hypothetical protein
MQLNVQLISEGPSRNSTSERADLLNLASVPNLRLGMSGIPATTAVSQCRRYARGNASRQGRLPPHRGRAHPPLYSVGECRKFRCARTGAIAASNTKSCPQAFTKLKASMADDEFQTRLKEACQDPHGALVREVLTQLLPFVHTSAAAVPYSYSCELRWVQRGVGGAQAWRWWWVESGPRRSVAPV